MMRARIRTYARSRQWFDYCDCDPRNSNVMRLPVLNQHSQKDSSASYYCVGDKRHDATVNWNYSGNSPSRRKERRYPLVCQQTRSARLHKETLNTRNVSAWLALSLSFSCFSYLLRFVSHSLSVSLARSRDFNHWFPLSSSRLSSSKQGASTQLIFAQRSTHVCFVGARDVIVVHAVQAKPLRATTARAVKWHDAKDAADAIHTATPTPNGRLTRAMRFYCSNEPPVASRCFGRLRPLSGTTATSVFIHAIARKLKKGLYFLNKQKFLLYSLLK